MNKIRETIRLHQEAGLSNRQIARTLGISRPSVSQYLTDYRSSGLSYSAIAAMSDDELVGMLEGVKIELSERYQDLSARFEYFVKELKRTGVTLDLLWHEYKREKPGGYNRTQFCHHFQVWRETDPELTMHLEHKAGERMIVDYPGKKIMVYDRTTGEGSRVAGRDPGSKPIDVCRSDRKLKERRLDQGKRTCTALLRRSTTGDSPRLLEIGRRQNR